MLRSASPRGFSLTFANRYWGLVCSVVLVCWVARSASAQQGATWEKDLTNWRAAHAADLQKPDGWLSLVGLVWLEPGDNSVGSANDNKVRLPESGPAHVGVLHLEG